MNGERSMKLCIGFVLLLGMPAVSLAAPPKSFDLPTAAAPKSFDWPQWQGSQRDAVSKEHGLLQEWPKGGPPLAWKAKDLGGGYSAPSIAAGRIFGMSFRDGNELVWALSE